MNLNRTTFPTVPATTPRTSPEERTRLAAFLFVLVVWVISSAPVLAQELEGPRLNLADAVSRTLEHSYNLQFAGERVEERRGRSQEATGLFDQIVFVDSNYVVRQAELLKRGLDNEIKRRVPFEFASVLLNDAAARVQARMFTDNTLAFRPCNEFETFNIFTLPNGDTTTICTDAEGGLTAIQLPADSFISTDQLITLFRVQRILDVIGLNIDGTIDDLIAAFQDEVRNLIRDLRTTAAIFQLQRDRIGDLPDVEQFIDFNNEAGAQFRFRNGLTLTSSVSLIGREDNYRDKDLSPTFGGPVIPNTFTTTLGAMLDIPLGFGRGKIATAGPSMAAETAVQAEEQFYYHTASEEALRAITAYWTLAAAQERYDILSRAVEIQSTILEATQTLVDADELPRVELTRPRARQAQVAAQFASTRQQIVDARMDLATSMGASPASIDDVPLASDALPSGEGAGYEPAEWVERALDQRRDLAAAGLATEATEILEKNARANLRRRIDLSINTNLAGFEENFVNRFYEPEGYWNAITGPIAGPSYGAKLVFSIPFKNNTARGKLVQARSMTSQSQINERDLERQIRLRVHEVASFVDQKRDQLAQQQELLTQLQQTLDSALELYNIGEITIIDLLTTEEQVTNAGLALVDVKAELAVLEAQLRFEAGELLEPTVEGELDPRTMRLATEGP